MPRYMMLLIVAAAVVLCSAQAEPKTDPRVEIMDFHAFDPMLGKQHELAEFVWPSHREVSALVRYEASGFAERKTASIHFAVTDRYGAVLFKDTRELALYAGQHEWVMPFNMDLSRLYATDRYNVRVEVKLTGGNRVEDVLEVIINGPPPPQVTFSNLSLTDPVSGEVLSNLKPRQLVMVGGTVEVAANTTPHLPRFMAYGLMSKDSLIIEDRDRMPFCDSYWDMAQLDLANGKWNFAIEMRMPGMFVENAVESQPFEIYLVVAFTPEASTTEVIAGTVLASGTGLLVSKNLGERLLMVERNWYWELEPTH